MSIILFQINNYFQTIYFTRVWDIPLLYILLKITNQREWFVISNFLYFPSLSQTKFAQPSLRIPLARHKTIPYVLFPPFHISHNLQIQPIQPWLIAYHRYQPLRSNMYARGHWARRQHSRAYKRSKTGAKRACLSTRSVRSRLRLTTAFRIGTQWPDTISVSRVDDADRCSRFRRLRSWRNASRRV